MMLVKLIMSVLVISSGALIAQEQQSSQMPGQNQQTNLQPKYRPIYASADAYEELIVDRMLVDPAQVVWGSSRLHSMGDQASVDMLKIVAKRPLKTTADLERALDMIHVSFEGPEHVIKPANRQPVAVLNLLDLIDRSTSEAAIKARVMTERNFVYYASTAKSLLSHDGDPNKPLPPGPPVTFPK